MRRPRINFKIIILLVVISFFILTPLSLPLIRGEREVVKAAPPEVPFFEPQVEIPGGEIGNKAIKPGAKIPVEPETFANYLTAFYNWAIGAIIVIGIVMIMFAGFQWMTAAGGAPKITAAKERITSALIGILLAVGSYAILNFINPSLVRLRNLSLTPVTEVGGKCTIDAKDDSICIDAGEKYKAYAEGKEIPSGYSECKTGKCPGTGTICCKEIAKGNNPFIERIHGKIFYSTNPDRRVTTFKIVTVYKSVDEYGVSAGFSRIAMDIEIPPSGGDYSVDLTKWLKAPGVVPRVENVFEGSKGLLFVELFDKGGADDNYCVGLNGCYEFVGNFGDCEPNQPKHKEASSLLRKDYNGMSDIKIDIDARLWTEKPGCIELKYDTCEQVGENKGDCEKLSAVYDVCKFENNKCQVKAQCKIVPEEKGLVGNNIICCYVYVWGGKRWDYFYASIDNQKKDCASVCDARKEDVVEKDLSECATVLKY